MGLLDVLLRKKIKINGTELPERGTYNFVSGITGVDNPVTKETDLVAEGGGGATVADDIVKQGGTNINRVSGLNRVPFKTATGSASPADAAAPPVGGFWCFNNAFNVEGYRAKRGSPDGWFDAKDYGAIGDGASHPLSDYFGSLVAAQAVFPHATSLTNELDWAAIQAAINAAMTPDAGTTGSDSRGGHVHLGRGRFICDQPLDCHQSLGLGIHGAGGHGAVGTGTTRNSATTVVYTGTGGGLFIDARSTFGFVLEKLAVEYRYDTFTGDLVNLAHYGTSDTSTATLKECTFSGGLSVYPGTGCRSLLYMNNAIASVVDNCVFACAKQGIRFSEPDGSYSNSHAIRNSQFVYLQYGAVNAGQMCSFDGCTFEGSGGTMLAAYANDFPETRASGGDTFSFSGSVLTRSGAGSFIDDGFVVGQRPNLIHTTSNNAVNGMSSTIAAVTATTLDFGAVTLTFTGNTIVRTGVGSFLDDGWAIGMIPIIAGGPGGAVTDGPQTAITNVTDTVITMTGTTYAGSTPSTTAQVYHLLIANFDAFTLGTPGLTFTGEAGNTTGYLYLVNAGGPITFSNCWFGDQYLSTAWFKVQAITNLTLRDNFISGNDRVLDVQFYTRGGSFTGNYFQCPSTPLNFSTEAPVPGGDVGIDGLIVQGNGGFVGEYVNIPSGLTVRGLHIGGNATDAATGDIEKLWAKSYRASSDAKAAAQYTEPDSVSTTDATPTILSTIAIPTDTAVAITSLVTATRDDMTEASAWFCTSLFRNNSGTVSQVGSTVVSAIGEDDATWGGPDLSVSGTNATLVVTGKASRNITWGCTHTRLEVIP